MAGCALIGLRGRAAAVWRVTLLGGSLLLWQSCLSGQWALLHEEVIAIVRFAQGFRRETGRHSAKLDGHVVRNARMQSRIHGFGPEEPDGFRLSYFPNNAGIIR